MEVISDIGIWGKINLTRDSNDCRHNMDTSIVTMVTECCGGIVVVTWPKGNPFFMLFKYPAQMLIASMFINFLGRIMTWVTFTYQLNAIFMGLPDACMKVLSAVNTASQNQFHCIYGNSQDLVMVLTQIIFISLLFHDWITKQHNFETKNVFLNFNIWKVTILWIFKWYIIILQRKNLKWKKNQ